MNQGDIRRLRSVIANADGALKRVGVDCDYTAADILAATTEDMARIISGMEPRAVMRLHYKAIATDYNKG